MKRFQAMHFILDSNKTHKRYWLTGEKLYNIGARLETPPRKSFVQLPCACIITTATIIIVVVIANIIIIITKATEGAAFASK
jgi:hypothetical protein